MIFAKMTAWCLAHRRQAIAYLAAFILSISVGIYWLRVDFSVEAFFGRNDPETAYLESYLERWGEDDMLVVLVDGGDQGLLHRSTLESLDKIARQIEQVDGVEAAIAPTDIPRAQRGFAGTFIPVPMLGTVPPDSADPARIASWREKLLTDTTLVPNFISPDGQYGAILVELGVDTGDLSIVRPVVEAVEQVVQSRSPEGMTLHIAGVPAIRANVVGVVVRDQVILVPIAGALMAILLFLLFRSRHGVLVPGIASAIPIAMLLGAMGWTGEPFGLLNQVLLALVPALAMADSVHIVSRYHEEAERLGATGERMSAEIRNQAIINTMQFMGAACFLTASTTVIGFLSLEAMDMPVLRSFGRYAGLGVSLAYIVMLFIVPLCLLGTRSGARRSRHGDEGWLGRALWASWRLTTRHALACVGVSLAFTAVMAFAASHVKSDWKITNTFNEDHPVSVANALLDEHLGGLLSIEIDLRGPNDVFSKSEVLRALWQVEKELRDDPAVRATSSLASVIAASSHLVGGPTEVPEAQPIVDRLYDLVGKSSALQRFVSSDHHEARLIVRTTDVGAIAFLKLGALVEEKVHEAMTPFGIQTHLTGSSVVAARGISQVSSDLRSGLFLDCAFIGLIIAMIFRSIRFGLLTLLPNALPLVAALGTMGIMGWNLEPGAAVVFTIAIGIAVDSAIHVLSRFREERTAGASVDDALRGAIYHSGRAIFISTLILIVGFAVNLSSSSPQNVVFGALGTVIMATSLLTNLLLLPALLKLGFGGKDDIVKA